MARGSQTTNFAVPAGAGDYAPEIMYLNAENLVKASLDLITELTITIESLPAGSQVEMDLLKPGKDPSTAANWLLAQKTFNAAGLQTPVPLSEWYGVRLRHKSGGAAAASIVHAHWS